MTERQQSLNALATAMRASYDAYRQVRALVLEELASYLSDAFLYVDGHGAADERSLAEAQGWKMSMASETLRELWNFGLLDRREERDESGRYFIYEVKG